MAICAYQPIFPSEPISTPASDTETLATFDYPAHPLSTKEVPVQTTSTVIAAGTQLENPNLPVSVLSDDQLKLLEHAAKRYISDTPEKAVATVRELNYATGADASLSCGPLAFAILQDAGLISPYFNLREFWLASPFPDKNKELFLEVFPSERYEWVRDTTPMTLMDFTTDPLLPGDLLYVLGGNYHHMFVVTRVEADGRAYSVQNIASGYLNGDPEDSRFVIAETLLYDPNQPGEGVVYQWANRANWKLGLIGLDGYFRFRPIIPIAPADPRKAELAEAIDAVISATGGIWYIQFETLGGEALYSRRPQHTIHPASVIKVAIAIGTMQLLESQLEPRQTLSQRLALGPVFNKTTNSRSYEQLLTAMLVNSEEEATGILYENLDGSQLKVESMLESWGLTHTMLEPRQSTVADMITLFRRLYQGELLSDEATDYILTLMVSFTPNDNLRLGQVKKVLGEEVKYYNKRGSLLGSQLIVADAAILETVEDTYLLQVYAYQDATLSTTYENLETAIGEIAVVFAQWLQTP
ncbi:MAG: serine hydrolase [Anaerolineaceae bacterium]